MDWHCCLVIGHLVILTLIKNQVEKADISLKQNKARIYLTPGAAWLQKKN